MKNKSGEWKTVRELHAETFFKDGDYQSIREVLQRINRLAPDNPIFIELDDKRQFVTYTSRDIYEQAMNLGDGLLELGLKDAHIAIVADNSARYVIADMAVSSGVGAIVPLDKDAPEDLLKSLMEKADVDAVFCSVNCLAKVQKIQAALPRVKVVATLYRKVDGVLSYDEIVESGKRIYESGKSVFRDMEIDLEAPAKMLFTSGTTGANKCVVLTSANLAANFMNCSDGIKDRLGNTSMSVLPMHHATEINTHIMTRVCTGALTYINDSIRNMMPNIKLFKPDIVTVVPMIANAFYKNIWMNAEKAGKADKLRKGIKLSNFLRKFGIDITHKMFSDIHEAFGGNLEMIVCGGAMLNPVVVRGLNDIGIRIENGYGITECGPLISLNADTLTDHLSVGKPCPGLEAKILNPDENGIGELCVRGKCVSKGYYKDDEATAAAFGADGFFNTGDSARIDDKGRIFLVGRKKNTIVLSNGKNINPEEVENIIETNVPYADEIVVYQASFSTSTGENKVIVAGLYISDENKRADRAGILEDIKKVNALMPHYKAIDYVELPGCAYEKTSTRKIKRTTLPENCSGEGIKII